MADSVSIAQSTLAHRLQDIPSNVFPHVRMGFSLLSSLTASQQDSLFAHIISDFSSRTNFDVDKTARLTGIDRQLCGDLISAVSLSISAVIDIDVTEEDFLSSAPESLISVNDRPVVSKLLNAVIVSKDKLRVESESSRVRNAVLPSFRYLDGALDVRFKFDDQNNIVHKVPVAIIYIDTDSTEEMWFQAGEKELSVLIDDLVRLQERLKILSRDD